MWACVRKVKIFSAFFGYVFFFLLHLKELAGSKKHIWETDNKCIRMYLASMASRRSCRGNATLGLYGWKGDFKLQCNLRVFLTFSYLYTVKWDGLYLQVKYKRKKREPYYYGYGAFHPTNSTTYYLSRTYKRIKTWQRRVAITWA